MSKSLLESELRIVVYTWKFIHRLAALLTPEFSVALKQNLRFQILVSQGMSSCAKDVAPDGEQALLRDVNQISGQI